MAESKRGVSRQIPGTLVQVQGVGILVTGDAGVGKSDTALTLLNANQQLVADDAVIIEQTDACTVSGYAPQASLGLLYLRGIGIIDVATHFGHKAVVKITQIQLRVHIDSNGQQPCQLKEDWCPVTYHGVSVPTLHFCPTRPLAVLIMAAAQEWLQGRPGQTATNKLLARHALCD